MKIEGNELEIAAMKEFHKGNRPEGLRLQEEFASQFRQEYAEKDHCPCQKACRYHGNCKECVAIHRAHQEHVPNCMRPLINQKLKLLSELTEHTLANEIEPPNPDKPEKLFLFSTPCVILKKKGVFICYSLINTLIKFMASLPVMTA